MSIRVDTSGLREFKEKLESFDEDALMKEIAGELAARLLRKVKKRTPVDTGELRRNWQVGNIHMFGKYCVVEVYNATEYAEWVEFGHRRVIKVKSTGEKRAVGWQPGKFMLTISTKEIDNIKDRLIRQRVEQKFREVF